LNNFRVTATTVRSPTLEETVMPEWLTTEELADELKVPISTVYKWRHEGTGPKAHRIGRHTRYKRGDLDRWLETRADTARPVA
jgi:excisionase family DNA binding protein